MSHWILSAFASDIRCGLTYPNVLFGDDGKAGQSLTALSSNPGISLSKVCPSIKLKLEPQGGKLFSSNKSSLLTLVTNYPRCCLDFIHLCILTFLYFLLRPGNAPQGPWSMHRDCGEAELCFFCSFCPFKGADTGQMQRQAAPLGAWGRSWVKHLPA